MAVQQRDNPNAEQAFLDYIEMGESRSFKDLAARYQTAIDPPTKRLATIADWSRRYSWQSRIATARAEVTEAKLREAAELDADTFLRTSRHLHRQVNEFSSYPDTVIKIRESVRKPMPKGGAVNVSIRVEIQSIVDRIAEEDGLNDSEKQELADAIERHLAATPK